MAPDTPASNAPTWPNEPETARFHDFDAILRPGTCLGTSIFMLMRLKNQCDAKSPGIPTAPMAACGLGGNHAIMPNPIKETSLCLGGSFCRLRG